MKIALVSLEQAWENKDLNLKNCKEYIGKAASNNVDLIVFPEMTLTGFSMDAKKNGEIENSSKTIINFKKLAQKYEIGIVFGVIILAEGKGENRLYLIDGNGEIKGSYTKIHLFSLSDEDKYYNPGRSLKVVDYKGYSIGLTVCYDLRFPELYSALSKKSDVVLNIANWPEKRVDHWLTLLKARAIENQIYMVGVNRTGKDESGMRYVESSNIFNANGERLEVNIDNNMKIYLIDKKQTKRFKETFNTTSNKEKNIYKRI
jgi:predicted amidohydrolase